MPKIVNILSVLLTLSVLAFFFNSCDNKVTGVVVKDSEQSEKVQENPYVEGNKNIMRRENEEIQMFLKRYNWTMQRTATGLYIDILNQGKGDLFKENDKVDLEYSTFLLSGENIYNSDSLGLKSFIVNRSEEIDALHEAVQLLRPDASAILIIPSYLGYGVAGDGDRSSGLQPIIMKIHILNEEQLKNHFHNKILSN